MLTRVGIVTLTAATFVCTACNARYSSSAFHLPADGNLERGKIAFVALKCHTCHDVPGAALSTPSVQPPVGVRLGGETDKKLSNAYLVTSMLDPSYQLAPYPVDRITSEGKSRMPSYANQMTLQQMVDIVTFLQSRYVIRRWEPQYAYY